MHRGISQDQMKFVKMFGIPLFLYINFLVIVSTEMCVCVCEYVDISKLNLDMTST